MELRHLRYYVAVSEAQSFRKAAERLRVAQPALSKQIKDLEREIGARLFERTSQGVTLTDAGGVFLDEARDILERADMALAAAREAGTGASGKLVIGSMGPITASFLPAFLASFRARYPKVDVNLRDLSQQDQLAALKAGTIQVGFHLHSSGIAVPPSFDSLVVLKARVAIAMCYQHRFAQNKGVWLRDLVDEQFLCAEGPGRFDLHRQRTLAILANHGVAHRAVKLVGSFDSLIALVAGNHGVALLLPTRAASSMQRIVFQHIREEGEDLHALMSVLWRKGPGSPLARNFVELLKSQSTRAPE